jgi:EAL domain-containing protein (putative c-di-GMP-specific phosphodiesterase class I)
VLAEGVDDLQLGTLLIEVGCQLAQGFAISRPMPAKAVVNWAKQWQPASDWGKVG